MLKIYSINKILFTALFLGLFFMSSWFFWNYLQEDEVIEIVIGAGSSTGDSYQFAQAIADVTNLHYPDIKISVMETNGSDENMLLLQERKIDLATVQSDIEAISSARIVSNLYPDMFQLLARDDSQIEQFHDLKGKRIALPIKGSGQWESFWFTANHYGLSQSDINVIELDAEEAIQAFINGEVDALFKVRAPRNKDVLSALNGCQSHLIPIQQAAALKLRRPSLIVGEIPKGTYSGSPLTPKEDLPTVSVNRLLVAHKLANEEAVYLITKVLFERRLELLKTTPLAGFISQPDWGVGTFIPIHHGAISFFERKKPNYFVANADFFALILSILLLVSSAVMGFRTRLSGKQKNLADSYTKNLLNIMNQVEAENNIDLSFIKERKSELYQMLSVVINDLDNDKLNSEGFQFFSFTWNTVMNLIQEKENKL